MDEKLYLRQGTSGDGAFSLNVTPEKPAGPTAASRS